MRGMNDIPPAETPYWRYLEETARSVLTGYGYGEIRLPLVEKTELFQRSIGEVTDIVEKEMYTFTDRGGDSLTLRPEATAGIVRAGIQHGLFHNQTQRLWCVGPMFRHERPQKGRYRQFHQIDVEAFGLAGPEIDAELILVLARLWHRLGLEGLRLEINSLGTRQAQAAYREKLVAYFRDHHEVLDEDSRRRLESNPLRILDSKNPDLQALIEGAPMLIEHLDSDSHEHFETLKEILFATGVEFRVNPRLVRGLDYYTRTVFEWVTDTLGAQNAVGGGGRYDGLVAEIGGQPTPATGFALGLERLIELLKAQQIKLDAPAPHAYLAAVGEKATTMAHALGEQLRDRLPHMRLLVDADSGSFKRKLRHADRSDAPIALILGESEASQAQISVKYLRDPRPQETLSQSALADHLAEVLFSTATND